MNGHRRFLPDRFRPRAPHRRSRRRFVLPVALLVTGLLLAAAVEGAVGGGPRRRGRSGIGDGLPRGSGGTHGSQLELEWLHQVAAAWPAASEVRVHLELPGTVVVEIYPESIRGSVPVGNRVGTRWPRTAGSPAV